MLRQRPPASSIVLVASAWKYTRIIMPIACRRLQDGIKAATGFDPRHQRLFKENGEEYDGEAAPGLT